MTEASAAPEPALAAAEERSGRLPVLADRLVRSIGPIVLALVSGGVLLALIGRDPFTFYGDILRAGLLRPSGLQDSITRMAPILLVGAGLIVAFRAGLWNLGSD